MKSQEELTEVFRDRGLKVTPQRQLIFRLLDGDTGHPTAEAVYERAVREMPTMSLRTVYQTLNDLSAMGELAQLDLGTGATRFDTNVAAHQHLVCEICGEVRDVFADSGCLEPSAELLAGFTVSKTEVVHRGTCGACPRSVEAATIPVPEPHDHLEQEEADHV